MLDRHFGRFAFAVIVVAEQTAAIDQRALV